MKNIHVLPTEKPSRLYLTTREYIFEEVYSLSTDECENKNIYITSDEYIGLSYYLDGSLVRKGVVDDKDYWEARKEYKKIILTTDQDLVKDGVQAIDDEFLEWFIKNPSCESVEVDKTIPRNFDGLDSVRQDKFLELFYKSELFDEIKYNDVFDWSVNEGKDYLKLFQSYKIIIPKEEPKQSTKDRIMSETSEETKRKVRDYGNSLVTETETLEEAAKKLTNDFPVLEVRFNMSNEEIYGWFLEALQKGVKWQQEQDKNKYSEEEVLKLLLNSEEYTSRFNGRTDLKHWFKQFKKK